jgi:hypothetical protein
MINEVKDDIVFMECPFCSQEIAAAWQPLSTLTDEIGRNRAQQNQLNTTVVRTLTDTGARNAVNVVVIIQWLRCQNTECNEIVVQATRVEGGESEAWFAVPKRKALPSLNQLVTDPLRKDYLEAWTILDDSPRMSAVLSRRVLADLLDRYARLKQYVLAQKIDEFIKDTRHPLWIRENLHYLREMGDFGAHSQEQKNAPPGIAATDPPAIPAVTPTQIDPIIIDVDKSEAEWTLRIVADLFDYFIVAPQRDKQIRATFDKKMADANRKPIKPLSS